MWFIWHGRSNFGRSKCWILVCPIYMHILGSMVSHWRIIVGLSQSTPAVGWGSPLHAWLGSVNWIGWARYLNRGYRYGARGIHYQILLRPYSHNYYTYNSVVKNAYSPCQEDACVQITIGNTEWLLRYKGVSLTCFSSEKACFHRERWLGETPSLYHTF